MRVEELLRKAGTSLVDRGIHNGHQEARWLLEHVLGRPALSRLAFHGGVEAPIVERFQRLLQRRLGGEPLQYVMASSEFYGLSLAVGPGVLIPRPETERLVDVVLASSPRPRILCDLCTGSGAIALALAHELGQAGDVWATDISATALAFARRNAAALQLPIHLLLGDLFEPLPPGMRFDVITANPPYVADAEYARLPAEVRDYEPRQALWAGSDGLDVLRRIARESPEWLTPGGLLICEIGDEQGAAAAAVFRRAGFVEVRIVQDYAGRDRVLAGRRSQAHPGGA